MSTAPAPEFVRRPAIGYGLYLLAATLFSLNGTVSKYLLLSGIFWARLSQLRVTLAFLALLVTVLVVNRSALRLRGQGREILAYGILGIAASQSLYFMSIQRMPIGVSLLFEFTAPIMVALWFKYVLHEPVRDRVFLALVLALVGLGMVAQIWHGFTLDAIGLIAAFGAAVAMTFYFIKGERLVAKRDPVSLTMLGFGAAALFWAIAQPWWLFPWDKLHSTITLIEGSHPTLPTWVLIFYMVVFGTVIPFALMLASLRHLRATQASIMGMTEPVIASLIAFALLGESMTPIQILGGAIVLGAVILAETSR